MSYDLHMLRVPPGEGAMAAFQRRLELQEKDLNPGPLVPLLEEEKRKLARILLGLRPELRLAAFDYAGLAAKESIDEAEARRRYRHLELNSEDSNAIQITLWDEAAELSLPYWHTGTQSEIALRQAWECAGTLETWGAFMVFDPQLERALDLRYDFEAVLARYRAGPQSTSEKMAKVGPAAPSTGDGLLPPN